MTTKLELAKATLRAFGGIAKTSDFLSAGVAKKELGAFCKARELARIRQGYYQLAGDEGMQKKWKAFAKKINTETDGFSTVLNTIKAFLAEPFASATEKQ